MVVVFSSERMVGIPIYLLSKERPQLELDLKSYFTLIYNFIFDTGLI
jgi:hypothetical protein